VRESKILLKNFVLIYGLDRNKLQICTLCFYTLDLKKSVALKRYFSHAIDEIANIDIAREFFATDNGCR